MNNVVSSWSGGKDSCFALMQALQEGYSPKVLLNVLNEAGKISRSHGIPSTILTAQANAANLPIHLVSSSWSDYENKFTEALRTVKQEYHLQHAVFGDIDLQPHRDWEEKVCAAVELNALLPLWQQNRRSLVLQMLDRGIETMIVSCNARMGKDFIGRLLTPDLIDTLEEMGIDACGENGEYHTLVLNCPLFNQPIHATVTGVVQHDQYWFSLLE